MRFTAVICSLFLISSTPAALFSQEFLFAKVDLVEQSKGKKVYLISEDEFDVKASLIKRIEFGKSTAIVTYLNKGNVHRRPNFKFRVINAYGIELLSFEDRWVTYVEAGETRKEEKFITPHNFLAIFEYSQVKLPEDWSSPVYLIVEGDVP